MALSQHLLMHNRKALDVNAYALMMFLTALFGFQQVAIKLVANDVSLLMQGGIRSIGATALLLAWARMRRIPLLEKDNTLGAGLLAGVLFCGEFFFIYAGLGHTTASRMVVFLYLTPPLTALALHFFVRGEQLRGAQWAGVVVAFSGLMLAFSDGLFSTDSTLLGDVYGLAAAVFWAATTVVIRRTALAQATATKTFLYQIGLSAAILPLASALVGESGVVAITALASASLGYQVLVAFGGYLAWFWLLTKYKAGPLSILTFMTPMFGVLFGVLLLSEPLTVRFTFAALLVAGGILLVNVRR